MTIPNSFFHQNFACFWPSVTEKRKNNYFGYIVFYTMDQNKQSFDQFSNKKVFGQNFVFLVYSEEICPKIFLILTPLWDKKIWNLVENSIKQLIFPMFFFIKGPLWATFLPIRNNLISYFSSRILALKNTVRSARKLTKIPESQFIPGTFSLFDRLLKDQQLRFNRLHFQGIIFIGVSEVS